MISRTPLKQSRIRTGQRRAAPAVATLSVSFVSRRAVAVAVTAGVEARRHWQSQGHTPVQAVGPPARPVLACQSKSPASVEIDDLVVVIVDDLESVSQ